MLKLPGKKDTNIIEAAKEIGEKLQGVGDGEEKDDSDGYETVSEAESTEDT